MTVKGNEDNPHLQYHYACGNKVNIDDGYMATKPYMWSRVDHLSSRKCIEIDYLCAKKT